MNTKKTKCSKQLKKTLLFKYLTKKMESIMSKERINMYLDRSRLELAQKKALERGVPISTAGNISELVRMIIDDYIDSKK